MLTRNQPPPNETDDFERDATISFDEIYGIARRQGWLVVTVGLLFAGLGLAYALTATPYYTASVKVIIDNPSSQLNQLNPFGDMGTDNATVLSQVELVKSEKIVGAVVDQMKLTLAPDNASTGRKLIERVGDWLSRVFSLASAEDEATLSLESDPVAARTRAIQRTSKLLDVRRLGMTYILSIEYTDASPARAAQIANSFATAYIDEQIGIRLDAAGQARSRLKDRINELTREAQEADLAVQQFRAKHQMVAVNGQRVDEQQLTELNTQLVTAIGEASQAEAKFQRIEEIIAKGDFRSLVTEALGSSIITDLRQKYLAVDKQAQELETLVGSKHARVLALREEMRRYEGQIFEELQRIRESTRSELTISRERVADLQTKVAAMSSVSAQNNEVLVEMKSLEDRASTARAMLQSLLQRDQEAQQGQSFAMSEARIISPAAVPTVPSYPNKKLFTLASLLLGLVGGAGLGYLREIADRSFRHGRQVEKMLGLPLIGAVPLMSEAKASQKRAKSRLVPAGADQLTGVGDAAEQSGRLVDYAVTAPMSGFAEALRSVKLTVDLAAPPRGANVIGFVSSYPGEGKSTLSKNLASLLALAGFRTILIDADLRAHGLTRYIDRDTTSGLVEVLEGSHALNDVLRTETISGLDVLLSTISRRIYNSSELLGSRPMRALLDTLRSSYDYVILDLPPLGPVVDAKSVAPLLDVIVMVVEWGVTPRFSVKTLLEAQRQVYERCAGIVFNKVDPQTIHRYDYYGSSYYGYGKYSYDKGYQNYYAEEGSGPKVRRRGVASWFSFGGWSLRRRRGRTTPSRGEVVIGRRGEQSADEHERRTPTRSGQRVRG